MSGKGSRPRPFSVTQEEFGNHFDNIFRKNKVAQDTGNNEKVNEHQERLEENNQQHGKTGE